MKIFIFLAALFLMNTSHSMTQVQCSKGINGRMTCQSINLDTGQVDLTYIQGSNTDDTEGK